ncbi:hypothetical protein AMTR_s00027p00154110 [Amborella trichopoda]|uniref:Uncharacterized protein n=1 Tax=Amborella trichopoda TaxID=13333 RepID=W1PTY5_AMBTC|nr:hypothetical protein AMTR_s00027p00154110 [Amborella trichopoda]
MELPILQLTLARGVTPSIAVRLPSFSSITLCLYCAYRRVMACSAACAHPAMNTIVARLILVCASSPRGASLLLSSCDPHSICLALNLLR